MSFSSPSQHGPTPHHHHPHSHTSFESYFSDGVTYKITSAIDGNVLDLAGGKPTERAKLIGWAPNGGGNQQWIASTEGQGFRLVPHVPMDRIHAADLNVSKQEVILFGLNGNPNQQWITERVPGPNAGGAVVITNLHNRTCLRYMGHGNQIKCTPRAFEDQSIWWYVTRV